ncbi:MAG TPA: UDP-2,3-diacylglucosamine diphosphatase [Thermoanaerobaculia bacterium]|jgi:UDP-2,3-diacylglucosamine hydrolase|nr:UDP-2,3-diacylglucosamine diphosphatase [Thermoanaerobaculia bacterium]
MLSSKSVIAVLADSHLGPSPADVDPFLRALSQMRRRGATALYLLGDVFHYLIADRKFATPGLDRFLEGVREFRASGGRVVYVEGNRDFFLRNSYLEPEFDAVADRAVFRAGRASFYLTHGDTINARDWPYRFWRFLSKNRLSWAAMKLVPRSAANRFVASMERRLRDTNFKHKSRLPVEMIERFARRRRREGYDVVLLGHFHEAWRGEWDDAAAEIVPPFLEEKSWIEVDEEGRTARVALA